MIKVERKTKFISNFLKMLVKSLKLIYLIFISLVIQFQFRNNTFIPDAMAQLLAMHRVRIEVDNAKFDFISSDSSFSFNYVINSKDK